MGAGRERESTIGMAANVLEQECHAQLTRCLHVLKRVREYIERA